ncbi:MAG TPA: ABC transporter ATP-binding protein [Thermoplasmata archaeon]|jgi:ABC-type branched-subunit amino acid transport system ATPase component|nr:ABC transporter ATP-binding protein [Thermoplasmata archaeon]
MALLEARGIVSGYGETEILHGVSITVDPGEFVTIIGPNGAGKSTLVKTIIGLLEPAGGSITFEGRNITGKSPEDLVLEGVAYIPQTNNTFPSMTVRENLAMGAITLRPGRVVNVNPLSPSEALRGPSRIVWAKGGPRLSMPLGLLWFALSCISAFVFAAGLHSLLQYGYSLVTSSAWGGAIAMLIAVVASGMSLRLAWSGRRPEREDAWWIAAADMLISSVLLALPGEGPFRAFLGARAIVDAFLLVALVPTKEGVRPRSSRWSKEQFEARVAEICALFPNLAPKLDARVSSLSGGEQQMVALAKTLVLDPKILLIDEPSAGLAPKLVQMAFEKIQEIHRRGVAIVLVEQNAKKALALADRGYVLEAGKNRYEGPGRTLLEDPDVGRLYLGG